MNFVEMLQLSLDQVLITRIQQGNRLVWNPKYAVLHKFNETRTESDMVNSNSLMPTCSLLNQHLLTPITNV